MEEKNFTISNSKISLHTKTNYNYQEISYRKEETNFVFNYTHFEKPKRKEINHRIWDELSDYLEDTEHVYPKKENDLFPKKYVSSNKEITVKRKFFKPILKLNVIRYTHYWPDKEGNGVKISDSLNAELLDKFLRTGETY